MLTAPLYILTVLALNVAISEWLVRHTVLRHFGSALLVIVVTAVVANLGLIPTSSNAAPLYDAIFDYIAPLAIFWLLLRVNLRDILQAGAPMLVTFLIGSVGTLVGVLVGMWAINGPSAIGDKYAPLGAMFVGTYTGGSVNFNALALEYGVMRDGVLYAGATAVDNIMTAVWMVATIALPRALASVWPRSRSAPRAVRAAVTTDLLHDDVETVDPMDLGVVVALGAGGVWLSNLAAAHLTQRDWHIPSIVILTAMALALAQIPAVNRLKGTRLLGMFAVLLFLAVIGAFCDVAALRGIGTLGVTLLTFVAIVVAVHAVITFGLGALFRVDPDIVAVASQANIGGGTSALALARSLGRPDLVLPAVLVGSLGYGVGTFLGVLTARYLL